MATVHHPHIPDHTREVDDDDVEAWVEQGWLKNAPKSNTAKSSSAGATPKEK